MTRTIRALLISFVALCGSQAMAVEFPNGFYGGIGGGVSVDKDFCTQTGSSKSCEERAFTWKILGGYQFMKWVALEGTLTDLNGPDTKTDLLVSVGDDVRKSTMGVTASAVFTAPVLEAMGFYGKLGGIWWDQEVKVSVGGQPTVQNDDNGVSWLWGVGFRYPFTDTFGIFIEYELYMDIGSTQTYGTAPNSMTLTGTDIDVYTASLVWRF